MVFLHEEDNHVIEDKKKAQKVGTVPEKVHATSELFFILAENSGLVLLHLVTAVR